MKFFKRELIGKLGVTGWRVEWWNRAVERYEQHFEAITSRLPVEVVQFHQLSLHDLVVEEVEWVAPKQLRLRIGWLQVFFVDVRSSHLTRRLGWFGMTLQRGSSVKSQRVRVAGPSRW
jgi:hypothetical protein